MPVQVRLAAPIFRYPQHGGRQLTQQSLQNSAGSGQHRDAVPFYPHAGTSACGFAFKGEIAGRTRGDMRLRPLCEPVCILQGSQMGRHRPHKPKMSGFDSRPCDQFHDGPLDHSGGHSPRKRESTVQSRGGPLFSNRGKVENPGSLISFPIVVRLTLRRPCSQRSATSRGRRCRETHSTSRNHLGLVAV